MAEGNASRPMRVMPRAAFYGLAFFLVGADQWAKAWVRSALPLGGTLPLWPGVFHLTYTQNRGMAFSLLEGAVSLLAFAALVVIGAIIWTERRTGPRLPLLLGFALALPLGGAVGNLIDRLYFGYVTDLFDARVINFPVFNVADVAITLGITLLAWRTLTTPHGENPSPHPTLTPQPPLPQAGDEVPETGSVSASPTAADSISLDTPSARKWERDPCGRERGMGGEGRTETRASLPAAQNNAFPAEERGS